MDPLIFFFLKTPLYQGDMACIQATYILGVSLAISGQ